MKLTTGAALAGLFALSNAHGVKKDTTICYTALTTSSVPYSTLWATQYTPCTTILTKVSKTWKKPTFATSTSTVYTTETKTAASYQSTATQTITTTSTSIFTSTSTYTTTNYTTVNVTATTTIPASSGFVGIQSSLPGAGWDGTGGPDPIAKRDLLDSRSTNTTSFFSGGFPKNVTCKKWSPSKICTTVTTTSTWTLSPISKPTSTKTVTSTLTSTFVPTPSTTTTSTFTSTLTSTSILNTTSTATATKTSTVTTSLYAACGPTNLADYYSDPSLTFDNGMGNFDSVITATFGDITAYDCCVAALLLPPSMGNPAGFAWLHYANRPDPNEAVCQVSVKNGACTNGQQTVQMTADVGTNGVLVLGNSVCGVFDNVAAPDV